MFCVSIIQTFKSMDSAYSSINFIKLMRCRCHTSENGTHSGFSHRTKEVNPNYTYSWIVDLPRGLAPLLLLTVEVLLLCPGYGCI